MDTGVRIEVDISDLTSALARLGGLDNVNTEPLMSDIGARFEFSMRERITTTKTAPDGSAWPANLEGTSILMRTGQHMLGSVAWTASATETEAGLSWEYAHVHQDGAVISAKNAPLLSFVVGGRHVSKKTVTIPARPVVGVSAEDAEKIDKLATAFVARQLGGGQ
ncbi:phage morphogenesis protein [Rhodopseudomonas sp. AAP120]|uniref:phage virion morphogenesis protein n=1 Tax=Rhodopseudomonas sp. AAP120 TaxID=1523430 RepID=UPI0006B9A287|nr:phage virion morphogenesis protein [Rhodopseudomonas sp. AAP120]KPF98810.1 phage morphogenesis protein [Rhodopseudomonas sp. AAP120]